jgi:hypothetical protein
MTDETACKGCLMQRTCCSIDEASNEKSPTSLLATFLAFVLPMLLILGALFGISRAGYSDGAAALTAIGILIVYYFGLYLFRKHIQRKFGKTKN